MELHELPHDSIVRKHWSITKTGTSSEQSYLQALQEELINPKTQRNDSEKKFI